MKFTATALLAATLATAGGAFAQTSVSDNGPLLSTEFPGAVTYADRHRNDRAASIANVFPASADVSAPMITKSFPNMVTYSDLHRNEATQVGSVFPASVDDNGPLLAGEFAGRVPNDGTMHAGTALPRQY